MALLGSFTKQPGEILPVDISYEDVIGERTATEITTTIATPSGMTKVSDEISGSDLQIYLSGGTDGVAYRWVVVTDITIGGKVTRVEDEFDVLVEEVSNTAG
jgi:hypothetical protein